MKDVVQQELEQALNKHFLPCHKHQRSQTQIHMHLNYILVMIYKAELIKLIKKHFAEIFSRKPSLNPLLIRLSIHMPSHDTLTQRNLPIDRVTTLPWHPRALRKFSPDANYQVFRAWRLCTNAGHIASGKTCFPQVQHFTGKKYKMTYWRLSVCRTSFQVITLR